MPPRKTTPKASKPIRAKPASRAESYRHPEADLAMRPEVGTQAQFRKKKPPKTYRYDSSLSPALDWDGQNPAREQGEALIQRIRQADSLEEAKQAAEELKRLSQPFLNWAGKAERLSFDVPTLPLFVHERLSTKAIVETLQEHRRDTQKDLFDLFGDPQHSITDQVLRAYEHRDKWVNRLLLGDSLVAMNSLLHYEGLGGQVQMIYMDPPYGVKFGSNFQPFVRKRDVRHNDDEDMTREPEMVQAYRDTWELGRHSYLTYMRDRLSLARDLLTVSGSIFVQINDANVHHVRELMDEIFGESNFVSKITFVKTSSASGVLLSSVSDYLLWYARDRERMKYRQLYLFKRLGGIASSQYTWVELPTGDRRKATPDELASAPEGCRFFRPDQMTSQRPAGDGDLRRFTYGGQSFSPGKGTFKTDEGGMKALAEAGRLMAFGNTLCYVRYLDDFPAVQLSNVWQDSVTSGFADPRTYVVQTNTLVVGRCILMSSDPGDLILDPTCGSGTTAYVAEQWGRRWITADTSRVPLALTRQRLLTATFPWYELKNEEMGPAGGFVYKRKQNRRSEEVGGIVPHVTLKSIVNDEPPDEEVLVDHPEAVSGVTRVSGPFVVEAAIPTPVDWEEDGVEDSGSTVAESYGSFVNRMIEVLRKNPILRLEGKRSVTIHNVRPPTKALSISAEALVEPSEAGGYPRFDEVVDEADQTAKGKLRLSMKPVAIVFGPENGAVSEKLVYEAAKEANAKNYAQLFVIGFAVQPDARRLIDSAVEVADIPATYIQATPDLVMGDLLKTMRSSQIFSVCGLPEIRVERRKPDVKGEPGSYQVTLVGLDVFDPVTMEVEHRDGEDVPAWFLDTDYNDLCFKVSQAFFPRTGAWENLKKALRATHEESVWEHLAGTTSAPFQAGQHRKIAVKVIDDRGNELLVVKNLEGLH